MRRKADKNEDNSTHKSIDRMAFDARRSISSLQRRVVELEKSVARLNRMRDHSLDRLPKAEPRRPGPKGIHRESVLGDRDRIAQMLEYYWPEIEPLCSPKPNAGGVKRVLESIPNQALGGYKLPATHLLNHLSKLLEFLSTNRFRRDPRQIANAFAGYPKIGIWRSLKVCQASPCNDHIGPRAIRAYIRRKHPELHGRLKADYSLLNFVTALRAYRSKDAKLKAFVPKYLFDSWKQCAADYRALGLDPAEFNAHREAQGGR